MIISLCPLSCELLFLPARCLLLVRRLLLLSCASLLNMSYSREMAAKRLASLNGKSRLNEKARLSRNWMVWCKARSATSIFGGKHRGLNEKRGNGKKQLGKKAK